MAWPVVHFETLFLEPQRNGLYKPKQYHGSGGKIVNMGELFAYRFIGTQDMQRLQLDETEGNRFGLQNGDLLFARRSLIEAGAGKCVIVEHLTEQTVFESSIIRVRLNQDKCVPRFYLYYFSAPPGRSSIEAIITGAAQKGIRGTELAKIDVHVPSLPTQRKIAAILSAYDDLIENNLRRMAILEEMARLIYHEWFVHFRFPGHEGVRFVDSPLGRIPEGWEIARLADLCVLIMGQSPSSEFYNTSGEGLPFHQGVTNFGPRFPETRVYCTVRDRIAEPGDILLSVRAPVGRMNIADQTVVIGRGLCAIRSRTSDQNFVFHQLKEKFVVEDSMGSGTIFKAVTKSDVENLPLLNPGGDLATRFESVSAPIAQKIATLTEANSVLRRTRDLLLPRLISGQVGVAETDIETEGVDA